ncbi:MAG: GIN domain-containing protein [Rhizomicrobium sp.]
MPMDKRAKSLLGGAAIAALLIIPTLGRADDLQLAANTPHHSVPPAPPAPPAMPATPAAPAAPEAPGWVRWPAKTYDASALRVEDLVGTLTVDVKDSGPMTVEVSGSQARLQHITVHADGNVLRVDGDGHSNEDSVWDWKNWFNFTDGERRRVNNLFVRVTIPRGSEVRVDDLVGNATIGDTDGVLRFGAAATTAHIGRVKDARIDVGGSGKIYVTQVDGPLHLNVGGSGKITVGPTQEVDADIAGSGDVTLGPIAGGMKLDIAGSGDVSAPRVNGPVHVEIAGSGSVKIADGKADPLHVEIMGAGNFSFGGVAVDPHIEAVGSGSVKIKSYTGKLDTEGMANVQIGGE